MGNPAVAREPGRPPARVAQHGHGQVGRATALFAAAFFAAVAGRVVDHQQRVPRTQLYRRQTLADRTECGRGTGERHNHVDRRAPRLGGRSGGAASLGF